MKTLVQAPAIVERLLGLNHVNDLYTRVAREARPGDCQSFLETTIEALDLRCHIPASDLERIPKAGPLIVVANHPFGAVEGIVLAAALRKVRGDVRLLANFLLQRIPELNELFFFVDPFDRRASSAANVSPLRQSIQWLHAGGALAMFPAGEVAHLSVSSGRISDPPWKPAAARLARRAGAAVLPVYFDGANGKLFQMLGLIHPRLRTAMLIRELLSKRGQRIDMRIGSVIPARKIQEFDDDAKLTQYLRERTYLLQHRPTPMTQGPTLLFSSNTAHHEPIAPAQDPSELSTEVTSLPASQVLIETGDYTVCAARAHRIPTLLKEIGRLREITFRATGEGTGKSLDLDTFDYDYLHLFVWNRARKQIVGGYRLGQTDVLLGAKGRQGLYTSTLFNYSEEALGQINPALELGRSFVSPDYQKEYAPLLLLWKGIGRFIVQNPRYKALFGPVSISDQYSSVSKQLMVRFLRLRHGLAGKRAIVTPRNAFRDRRVDGWDDSTIRTLLHDGDDISDLVSEIEPDKKGIPVLLRQYLKFGAKLLAINVDPNFSNVVDGLLMADLTHADRKMLNRYMGADGADAFLNYHSSRK